MYRLLATICTCLTRCHAASGTGAVRRGGRILFNRLALPLILLLLATSPAAAFDIDNTATVDYVYGGSNPNTGSNLVRVTVTPPPSAATIEFLRLTADPLGTTLPDTEWSDSDPPGTFNQVLPVTGPGNLSSAASYLEGEMVVIRVTDADQNLDPLALDTVLVRLNVLMSGDDELLRLTETGLASGIFEGYIHAGISALTDYDGYLNAPDTSQIDLSYDDGGLTLSLSNPVLGAAAGGSLWLQLSADRTLVAPGDIFTYRLEVENTDVATATAVTVTQQLPSGFRYQAGSATHNGLPAIDPTLSSDGNTLTFSIGDLLSGATFEIDFRSMVGAVLPGKYPSDALAQATSGQISNPADATVNVRDELGNGKNIIAGRVLNGCDGPGVEGIRIYMEDGTYVLTDARGRYHVEGIDPGTHVVQLDPITLPDGYEAVLCEDHTRFAGNASSRFVDLQPGSLWRGDFYISEKPVNGEVTISLDNEYEIGSAATYIAKLSGKDIPFLSQKLEITLPAEATYLPGSSLLDGASIPDPEINGQLLTYNLPDKGAASWHSTLILRTFMDQESMTKEMLAYARLRFATPTQPDIVTPDAESTLIWISRGERATVKELLLRPHFGTLDAVLTEDDLRAVDKAGEQLRDLDLIKIFVVGHTDARRINWREGILYRDNFELSEARAEAVSKRLQQKLDLDPSQLIIVGMGAAEPIADNETTEGMSLNRRTELRVLHRYIIDPENEKIESSGGNPKFLKTEPEKARSEEDPIAVEMGILSPVRDSHIAHSVESIRIRMPIGLSPELTYDGIKLPSDKIGFQMNEPETKTQILTYIGIELGEPGEHTLHIKGIGPFGNVRYEDSSQITRTGEAHRIELAEEQQNVADGKTPVKLKLNLYDELGNLIQGKVKLELREGTLVPATADKKHLHDAPETRMVWFDTNGIAQFEAVNKAGLYQISLGIKDHEELIDIYVAPEQRDWILVGLAEGTTGYNSVSGNIQPLDPNAPEEDYYDEGRIAFFAKGQIKGNWLLTLAYDSDKEDLKDRSLHQVIDPDSYYTVYGDTSEQGYDAASAEKLYVRIERDRFFAFFGDIGTGMNVTELSRYNRILTGIQTEYSGRNFGYTAFASETAQSFIRDEIRGDGTSGLYRLSQNDIVINSETIVLETRDRFHSEQILESRTLQRHLDYDIDYAAGTLYFKEPVQSRDHDLNPIFITVDYETTSQGAEDYTFGGRAYTRFAQNTVEVGASLVHEGQNTVENDLYGIDTRIRLSDNLSIRGEWATTEARSAPATTVEGDAWLAEIKQRTKRYDLSAYMREQQAGFGLGQQNASESGTRKYGADLVYRISEEFEIDTEFYEQENLATGDTRNVEEAAVRYHNETYTLTAGLRHAEDSLAGIEEVSDQATFGADYHVTEKLDLTLRHEQSISNNENRDYPTRTAIGARYQINRAVSLFAEHTVTNGDSADTADTRVGLNAAPWDGAQIRTSMEQNLSEAGRRTFGNLGLLQTWQINPKLSLNFSVDRSQLISGINGSSIHPDQPPAAGSSEDYTAFSTGFSWREIDRTFDTRLELRTSESEDKYGIFAGSIIEPETFLGLSLHGSYFNTERSNRSRSREANLSLGVAYRPDNRNWIVLNRLDLLTTENVTTTATSHHWKIVERLNAFWRANRDNRLTFKLGARYAADEFDTLDYSGMTWLFGTEWRHDINRQFDIGLHGSILAVEELAQTLYHSGASVGYSPAKNFWISLGYNYQGYQDDDFSQADYTAQGPYVKFRVKFDQNSVRDALKWLKNN